MKNLLFRWGTMCFYQFENGKVLGVPIMVLLVSIVAFPLGITYGYDAANDIPLFTTLATKVFAVLWVILLIGWVIKNKFTSKASIETRDKYWRTQLVRFKDPKFLRIKLAYPNWQIRELELEKMWLTEYGTRYEDTKQPLIGKFQFLWFVITSIVGFLIGFLIG